MSDLACFYCSVCDRRVNSSQQWHTHISGSLHQKVLTKELNCNPNVSLKYSDCGAILCPSQSHTDPMDSSLIYPPRKKRQVEKTAPTVDMDLNLPYRCTLCAMSMNTYEQLKFHQQGSKHRSKLLTPGTVSSEWYCSACNTTMTGVESYKQHLQGRSHQRQIPQTSYVAPQANEAISKQITLLTSSRYFDGIVVGVDQPIASVMQSLQNK